MTKYYAITKIELRFKVAVTIMKHKYVILIYIVIQKGR